MSRCERLGRALARCRVAARGHALEFLDVDGRAFDDWLADQIANAELSARVGQAMRRIHALETKRATLPTRVPVRELVGADVVKLAVERKHLTDLLKMVAYQAEGDLVRLLAPHDRRTEHEGRSMSTFRSRSRHRS